MKTFNFIILSALLLGSLQVNAQSQKPILDRIENIISDFMAYDSKAFSENFTPQTRVINPLGMTFKSPEEIHQVHAKVFESWGTPPSDASIKMLQKEVQFLSTDLAMANLLVESSGDKKAGEGKMNYTFLLQNTGGTWLIKFAQLTPVIDMAVAMNK